MYDQVTSAARNVRQKDLVPLDQLSATSAILVGVGAVGYQVARQLAAMGVGHLTLIDFDAVEVANLGLQGWCEEHLGRPKVEAARDECLRLNPALRITALNRRFRKDDIPDPLLFDPTNVAVFCCVDTMEGRGFVGRAADSKVGFFSDARIAGEVMEVYSYHRWLTGYQDTLVDDAVAHEGSCSAKAATYVAGQAAMHHIAQFAHWLRGLEPHCYVFSLFDLSLELLEAGNPVKPESLCTGLAWQDQPASKAEILEALSAR